MTIYYREGLAMNLGTLCPQCGFDVRIDEDGLCVGCGATAIGEGVDKAIRMRRGLVRIRANGGKCESAIAHAALDEPLTRDECRKIVAMMADDERIP